MKVNRKRIIIECIMSAIHITDIEAAINFWRDKSPSKDGVTLPKEIRELAKVYAELASSNAAFAVALATLSDELPEPEELIVTEFVTVLVVRVTLLPATKVNGEFALFASTVDCPDTTIVPKELPP